MVTAPLHVPSCTYLRVTKIGKQDDAGMFSLAQTRKARDCGAHNLSRRSREITRRGTGRARQCLGLSNAISVDKVVRIKVAN